MNERRIPKAFYNDHVDRDLPAPTITRETKAHYWINTDDTDALAELIADARFYVSDAKYMDSSMFGIARSAAATLKALA